MKLSSVSAFFKSPSRSFFKPSLRSFFKSSVPFFFKSSLPSFFKSSLPFFFKYSLPSFLKSSLPAFLKSLVPSEKWRRGALMFAAASIFTFIVNLSFTIWAMTNEAPDGVGVIWEGEQTTVKAWNTAMHVVVNLISTILLAGSNYCMQCLMAPTRRELDKAHSEKRQLDIGIPTIRNFWSITLRKKLLWILLSVSSFPLHLLFNSIIFASISTNRYYMNVIDARSVSLKGDSSLPETLEVSRLAHRPHAFPNTTLHFSTPSNCLEDYSTAFQSKRGSVLIVTDLTGINETSIQDDTLWYEPSGVGEFSWICTRAMERGVGHDRGCDEEVASIKKDLGSWKPFGLGIQACYSNETEEHSKLFFSTAICWVVTSLNLLKGILMLLVAYDGIGNDQQPILTIGDAVASYLGDPDKHTKGMCLKSKNGFAETNWETGPQIFFSARHRKFGAGSAGRWVVCILLCLLALCACGLLLAYGLLALGYGRSYGKAAGSLGKYGLGVVHSDTIMSALTWNPNVNTLIVSVVLVNTPQVVMSLIYFNYNALFTCISLATEWDRFSSGNKKGLRVFTKPQGAQRQTYFLQLPYRYSLTLAVFSGCLHWLISQSIFLVRVEIYNDYYNDFTQRTSCGWSPIGIILVISAGLALIGYLVASGFRRLRHGGIPVVASCSAAISAACHPEPSEPASLTTLPLSWGVVSGEDATPGHCSFTTKDAEKPVNGRLYE